MMKLDHVKRPVNWVSATFMVLFCILFYYNFSKNIMLANAMNLPSYANVSSSWNMASSVYILVSQGRGTYYYPLFTLGIIYSSSYNEYNLAIYFYRIPSDKIPTYVWYSYPNYHSSSFYNATLELTLDGDLVLKDAQNGSYLWSTNTSGLSVESMHLKEDGNLVLLNGKGDQVWESHSHPSPTSTLLNVKQGFSIGQRLTSSTSPFNSTRDYYVEGGKDGLHAYVCLLDPPQQYKLWDYQTYNSTVSMNLKDANKQGHNFSFLFLDVDGHLKWVDYWNENQSYLSDFRGANGIYDHYGDCSYPNTCGEYGVCGVNGCSCPKGNEGSLKYFMPVDQNDFTLGCTLVTPLSCSGNSEDYGFLELEKITYFDYTPSLIGTDVESCKRACLKQCSCKAVFFHYYDDPSFGNCTLPSKVLTLMDVFSISLGHEVITFLKVQNQASTDDSSKTRIVIYLSISLIFTVFITGALCFVLMRVKKPSTGNDFSLYIMVDTITRFSIKSLNLATQNFQTRLGRGGFGSVYEGTLVDGTKVAVKCLESCRQGTKEFLAEVNTIGSIHHFNLVRLIGFCDEGFSKLLVYEFMCNGSLDKWIFNHGICEKLTWNIRRRIIEGLAEGLEYLHEHCNKNVIHFDIKPQNILLDKDFNVKISDFGLAKMVDRDESQVMTVVRGTPGYMAPELMNNNAISVKIDVYSFGVVILEIVSGRRNFGSSQEDTLTNLVKAKANQDQLSDLIDARVQDMQRQKGEVVNMMKIAIWCLQPHFIRPTMPKVVKVLQDISDSEALNNLSDLTMAIDTSTWESTNNSSVRPVESILSGPR